MLFVWHSLASKRGNVLGEVTGGGGGVAAAFAPAAAHIVCCTQQQKLHCGVRAGVVCVSWRTDGRIQGSAHFLPTGEARCRSELYPGGRSLGEQPPAEAGDETGPDSVRTKADIIAYLKGSFAALHKAAATIDEMNLMIKSTPISPLQGTATRLGLIEFAQ